MPSQKTKSSTLTRVRDNQRRCRARKREYVLELERRLQERQVAGIRPDLKTYQKTMNRLKDENRSLRELLGQVGVSKTCVEAHLREDRNTREGSGNPDRTDGQVLSYLQEIEHPNGLETPQAEQGTSPSLRINDLLNTPFCDLSEEFRLFDSTQSIPPADLSVALPITDEIHPTQPWTPVACTPLFPVNFDKLTSWSLPPLSLIPGDLGVKLAQKECDTTLCTVAYEMIRRHNKKGVDMIEIGIRLWNGFVKGDRDDGGCKVENKLLFSVLDDISG